MRTMSGTRRALSRAAMTSGNRVYPMMQIDWKNELRCVSAIRHEDKMGPVIHVAAEQLDL